MAKREGMENPAPRIDLERCNGCGRCILVCEQGVLAIVAERAQVVNPDACTYEMHCERACPATAISHLFLVIIESPKEQPLSLPTFISDWREKVVFGSEGPQPQILVENERMKAVLVGLDAGQRVPLHPAPQGVFHFVDGSGWMTVEDVRHPVHAGTIVIVPEGAKRGIEADERLVFIAVRVM
ncbi:MAG: 4Fe-4S binding protein [Chloroflexi bacterium]|nr:4Fe-4S binding protein [Chloroflexota bacterium]